MSNETFMRTVAWLVNERDYQTGKFDYAAEAGRKPEQWIARFDNYTYRMQAFPQGTSQHLQATLKLAATVVAYAEHQIAAGVPLPKPGQPSGEIKT